MDLINFVDVNKNYQPLAVEIKEEIESEEEEDKYRPGCEESEEEDEDRSRPEESSQENEYEESDGEREPAIPLIPKHSVPKAPPGQYPRPFFAKNRFLHGRHNLHYEYDKLYKYRCEKCPGTEGERHLKLKCFTDMATHMRAVHHTARFYAYCCQKKITTNYLTVHLHMHLEPETFDPKYKMKYCFSTEQDPNKKLIKTTTKNYCTNCKTTFPDTHAYREHIEACHVELCDLCGETVPAPKRAYHLASKHTKPVPCPECGLILKSAASLYQHRKALHKKLRYTCPFCDFVSKYSAAVKFHTASKHNVNPDGSPISLIPCTVCGKEFKNRGGLREHSAIHSNERRVSCQFCEKSFKTTSNYGKHRNQVHRAEYEEFKRERDARMYVKLGPGGTAKMGNHQH